MGGGGGSENWGKFEALNAPYLEYVHDIFTSRTAYYYRNFCDFFQAILI